MSEFQPETTAPPPVIVQDDQPVITPPEQRAPAGPRWETEARERVKAGIRRLAKPLKDLLERDANEGDTRMVVNRLLTDVLGYDEFSDLTTEYAVKGEFADYGIRIDRDLVAFIEVKRAATKLAAKHLRQAEMYAVNEGVEWIILTNGAEWRAYHLSNSSTSISTSDRSSPPAKVTSPPSPASGSPQRCTPGLGSPLV
jgi:hypothetical protein